MLSLEYRRRRRRPDDEPAGAGLERDLRGSGTGVYRGSSECRWIDAAALPLVVWHIAGGLQTYGSGQAQEGDGTLRPAEYRGLPDTAAVGLSADRPDVCDGCNQV